MKRAPESNGELNGLQVAQNGATRQLDAMSDFADLGDGRAHGFAVVVTDFAREVLELLLVMLGFDSDLGLGFLDFQHRGSGRALRNVVDGSARSHDVRVVDAVVVAPDAAPG